MTEHKVRLRMTFPKPGGSTLFRSVCNCGERSHLTPIQSTAEAWAEQHLREDRA